MGQNFGRSDPAEGFCGFVAHHIGFLRILEDFQERRDGVWGEKLAEDECDFVSVQWEV